MHAFQDSFPIRLFIRQQRNAVVLISLLFASPSPSAAAVTAASEQAAAIINSMSPVNGPGIQYIVADKDRIIFEHAAGMADIAEGTPLDRDHTMAAFSMTKTLTAIAVLQLAEQEKLGLDDRADRFVKHPYPDGITIRQLLAHTAGLPDPIPITWVHLAEQDDRFDENAALTRILLKHGKADSTPGQRYGYSNIGYWLLGKVVEAAAGQDFTVYVERHLFRPLDLEARSIGFKIPRPAHHAKGYLAKYSFMNLLKGFLMDKEVWGAYEGSWLRIKDVYLNGPAFGGAIGSARAFSRILQDLLRQGSLLLGKKGKALLFEQQRTQDGRLIEMTLGWHIGELDGQRYYYKEGGGAGFHCEMRIYPSAGLASVIMTNRTAFDPKKALGRLDRLFMN